MRRSRRLGLLLTAAALWLAGSAIGADVSAHAAYVESTPAFGAVLTEPPQQLQLQFTQELFRREGANTLQLIHQSGPNDTAIDLAPLQISNANRRQLTAALADPAALAPGRYVVRWTNLSAEDGDPDRGWYPFYLQQAPTAAEEAADRAQAQALLIDYPPDGEASPAADAPTAAPPAVVRVDPQTAVSLSVGAIAWLAAGLAVGLGLAGVVVWRRRAGAVF